MEEKFEFYALKLTGICIIVYILMFFWYDFFIYNFALVSQSIWARPWTLITHMFMHGGYLHLFYNMFALALFGSILEKYVGYKTFLILFFVGGIFSSIADIMFYNITLGASGAIFAVLGSLAALRPKLVVWAFGAPMYMIIAVILWTLIDLVGVFYPDNIAHFSHLFGLAFGVIYGLWLRTINKEHKKKPSKKEKQKEIISDEELDRWEEKWMKT